jgi:hypothetical protein
MKIFKVFLLLFFFLPTYAYSQLKIGVTGGVVLSSLVRDNQLNARAGTLGYLFGANARINLGELGWFVQSGISYSLEGDNDQNLNFIKIPMVLGLDVSDDVNIHAAYDFAWQVGNQNNVQDFYNGNANMLGLGAEINISEKFAMGFRLNYGLSNLVNDPAKAKNFKIRPFTLDLYLNYYLL